MAVILARFRSFFARLIFETPWGVFSAKVTCVPTVFLHMADKVKSRRWAVTRFQVDMIDNGLKQWENIVRNAKYWIYQVEVCPTTARRHIQGYFEAPNPVSAAGLKKRDAIATFTKCEGSAAQNIHYCSKPVLDCNCEKCKDCEKPVAGFFEFGERPKGQGKRTDLDDVIDKVKDGASLRDIAMDHSKTYVRNFRGVISLKNILAPKRDFQTIVLVYWGPTGTGKTRHAKEIAGDDVFTLTHDMVNGTSGQVWWDLYDGQSTVILEEFYGWIKMTQLFALIDSGALQVQTKGGSTSFRAERIIITSNKDPKEWYPKIQENPILAAAFNRRFMPPVGFVNYVGYGQRMDSPYCEGDESCYEISNGFECPHQKNPLQELEIIDPVENAIQNIVESRAVLFRKRSLPAFDSDEHAQLEEEAKRRMLARSK